MTCEPFCDSCGGNLGHPANGDWTCRKCKLRQGPKKRITKAEFEAANGYNRPEFFPLRTRAGGWRYYRAIEDDPMIFVGDGQYRRRSLCSPADLANAKRMGSAMNAGLV
jgi:hypothetical protein